MIALLNSGLNPFMNQVYLYIGTSLLHMDAADSVLIPL